MIRFICIYLILFCTGFTFQPSTLAFDLNQNSSINALNNGHTLSGAAGKSITFEPVDGREFLLSNSSDGYSPGQIESDLDYNVLSNIQRQILSKSIGSRSPPFLN